MPETAEELIALVKSGTIIKCDTVEQCREALRFFEDAGETLGAFSKSWLDSGSNDFDWFQHVGYSASGTIGRFMKNIIRSRRYFEFEDITPVLRSEPIQDFEIDGAVFEEMFL